MDFTSITVVSFALAAVAALIIEFPFNALLRPKPRKKNEEEYVSSLPMETVPLYNSYGATAEKEGHYA
jgi:hypothetical protein